MIVSVYNEQLTDAYAAPTVKQHLAAIGMLFEWLVVGQIVATNPASRGSRSQSLGQDLQDARANSCRSANADRQH